MAIDSHLLITLVFFHSLLILNFNEEVAGVLEVLDYSVKWLSAHSQLPLRVLNEHLYDLYRMLLLEYLQSLAISTLLFGRVWSNPGQLYP